MASAPARSDDPPWANGKVVVGAKNSSICVHCSKRINDGGITRLKCHLTGIKGEVKACKKVPPEVKWQMKQLIEDLTIEKEKRKRLRIDIGNSQSLSSDEVEEDVISGQLEEYKKATGDFGMTLAIGQREKLNPVAW
ncbi:hypothetical protein POTOM_037345 [Populus tomentosa]|uniref:BED-type domain-containing protein n=1 Tax=Populus tomentosa TaxID=118781 RepID=A0A8X8CKF4_POPTO|nr:hypothetical protein POTOM_037345 [Populus tomentosa]